MVSMSKSYALVIGIAKYRNLRELPYVDDAKDIAGLLTDTGYCGYPSDHVRLLEESRATRSAILEGLAELAAKVDSRSTAFIYFSGHGGQIKEGPHKGQYLLPVDVAYPFDYDLARSAISGTELTEALNAIKAQRLTVILDCCHAGGIGEPQDIVPSTPVEPGLSDNYLDEVKAGTGRVIIAATRSSDPAWVRHGEKHGVFTGHLLEGLRGGARGDGGIIRILDLYSYVQQKVVADQPNQRPVLKVELEDNYPIALYRGGKVPVPTPTDKPADGFAYDVFISYRQQEPDKTWVRRTLVLRLKAAGLKVFIDHIDFRLGAPIVSEIERAVMQSRYTVGVLSPNYLKSNFTDLESILAQHIGLEQSQLRFIGVMREDCKPRLVIRARYYLDMMDEDEFEAALARLVAQLRQPPDIERIKV